VSAGASAASGRPALKLTTSRANSLIFAVGTSHGSTTARVLPIGWVTLSKWRSAATGDTDWSQYTNWPVARGGTKITVSGGAPAAGPWNLAAVALPGDGD
jgi:hypothetical protein